MKKLILMFLCGVSLLTATAQEKVYQIDEVSVINYGDGRLLFRLFDKDKTPLQGSHRIIDGYHSEYILADFKDGMYNGAFQHFKHNKLFEEGTYLGGRKDGIYKKYYSDGKTVEKETPYKEGKLNGVVKTYYTDGKIQSEKGYAMSVEEGVERRYDYQTGTMTTDRNYKEGKLHGTQKANISSNIGEFTESSTYDMGKLVGEFSEIFSDGTIRKIGQYNTEGQKDGEWFIRASFAEDGKFSGKRVVYKNGEVVSEEQIKDFPKFERKKL